MEENLEQEIDRLAEAVKGRTAEIDRCDEAEKLMELQNNVAAFMDAEIQRLIAKGAPVTIIQEKLRAVVDRVPASYAEDSSAGAEDDGSEDEISEQIDLIDLIEKNSVVFSVVDKKHIIGFEDGTVTESELLKAAGERRLILKSLEELIMVLSAYREKSEFDAFGWGGNILAGPSGEALVPQWFEWEDENGGGGKICEPMVYKTGDDIKTIMELVNIVDLKMFTRNFNIKKLLKAGGFPLRDEKSLKNHKAEILQALWHDFLNLRSFYRAAALTGKWITGAVLSLDSC
jgi:hypothetical protein